MPCGVVDTNCNRDLINLTVMQLSLKPFKINYKIPQKSIHNFFAFHNFTKKRKNSLF